MFCYQVRLCMQFPFILDADSWIIVLPLLGGSNFGSDSIASTINFGIRATILASLSIFYSTSIFLPLPKPSQTSSRNPPRAFKSNTKCPNLYPYKWHPDKHHLLWKHANFWRSLNSQCSIKCIQALEDWYSLQSVTCWYLILMVVNFKGLSVLDSFLWCWCYILAQRWSHQPSSIQFTVIS